MMGDDTWLQLFPTGFTTAFPFPSFNVKDLHTVDDGVVNNLFPALYDDNWDVLIGHFLGVDHVGHIFGVESPHMVEKLEQYNQVIEDVIAILRNQSSAGGLHEDTLLLVMGDHGQTLNGDHGGGTPEEVETALFAWATRQPAHSIFKLFQSSCVFALGETGDTCIYEFPQLDFAATLSALIGVPFPFGSIGRVNAELYSLVVGTWTGTNNKVDPECREQTITFECMERYLGVLCLNSQQVNRFFEQYTESALNGFHSSDLSSIQSLYHQARSLFANDPRFCSGTVQSLRERKAMIAGGVDAYTKYLNAAAALARSKWTQFDTNMMAYGLMVFVLAFVIQTVALCKSGLCGYAQARLDQIHNILLPITDMMLGGFLFAAIGFMLVLFAKACSLPFSNQTGIFILGGFVLGSAKSYIFSDGSLLLSPHSFQIGKALMRCQNPKPLLAVLFCILYASSLLSNSFILKEHRMVTFLLASLALLDLRHAMQHKSKVPQALCLLVLNFALGCIMDGNIFKETDGVSSSQTLKRTTDSSAPSMISIVWSPLFLCMTIVIPLSILGFFFIKKLSKSSLLQASCRWAILIGLPLCYMALCFHWALNDLVKLQPLSILKFWHKSIQLYIPRMVYLMAAVQSMLLLCNFRHISEKIQLKTVLEEAPLPCLAVWSGPILLLYGKHGPGTALLVGIEGYLLLDMQSLHLLDERATSMHDHLGGYWGTTIQWSLFAVQLFFVTGHRCAFDGLRYAAAFLGFDEFNMYRQGALLAMDTFGASHILPVIGLVLFIAKRPAGTVKMSSNCFYILQLSQGFLLYGLVRTLTTVFTTLCVTIHRRHLMVWGLFAPKFVFDGIGLLVTDCSLLVTALYCLFPLLRR